MQGGRDVVGSAARAVPFDRSAVSDKAAIDSPVGATAKRDSAPSQRATPAARQRGSVDAVDPVVPIADHREVSPDGANENRGAVTGAVFDAGKAEKPYCASSPLSGGPAHSNSSVSAAEPTMPEAVKPQVPRPAVSGTYSPWKVDKPQLEPVVVERSLEDRLERAERELVCAQHIDNWHRCQQETARYTRIVTDLKRQIAERDAEVCHA